MYEERPNISASDHCTVEVEAGGSLGLMTSQLSLLSKFQSIRVSLNNKKVMTPKDWPQGCPLSSHLHNNMHSFTHIACVYAHIGELLFHCSVKRILQPCHDRGS